LALERRRSPLAEKRFGRPVVANLWLSAVAIKRQGSPVCCTTDGDRSSNTPLVANLGRSPMAAGQVKAAGSFDIERRHAGKN
jgi:hypothetical protein